jgi:hypothetical protein
MFQSTVGSIRRLTPSRRIGIGWIAPSLKGGYRDGMPGIAGRQVGISLKGEVSDHKGNFDENNRLHQTGAQHQQSQA